MYVFISVALLGKIKKEKERKKDPHFTAGRLQLIRVSRSFSAVADLLYYASVCFLISCVNALIVGDGLAIGIAFLHTLTKLLDVEPGWCWDG